MKRTFILIICIFLSTHLVFADFGTKVCVDRTEAKDKCNDFRTENNQIGCNNGCSLDDNVKCMVMPISSNEWSCTNSDACPLNDPCMPPFPEPDLVIAPEFGEIYYAIIIGIIAVVALFIIRKKR